jgi:hypothetical protein
MVLIETIDHEVSAGKFWLRAGPARGAAQSPIDENVLAIHFHPAPLHAE